jgi:hypothetical protein
MMYFTDKTNSVTNETMGMTFLGKSSKNLLSTLKTHAVYTFPVSSADSIFNYTYEYNSNGWVTKMIRTPVPSGAATSETYTYY